MTAKPCWERRTREAHPLDNNNSEQFNPCKDGHGEPYEVQPNGTNIFFAHTACSVCGHPLYHRKREQR